MININLLQSLSYIGGVKLLLEEGYVEGKCIEKDDESCDKLFLYPFSLYDDEKLIDQIYHAEYCNIDEDGEYEEFRAIWLRR